MENNESQKLKDINPVPTQLTEVQKTDVVNVNQPAKADQESTVENCVRIGIPAFFSLIIILLCGYKIITDEQVTPELRAVYWSTLTGTAASWIPSPARRGY